jgi:hypothetical protein
MDRHVILVSIDSSAPDSRRRMDRHAVLFSVRRYEPRPGSVERRFVIALVRFGSFSQWVRCAQAPCVQRGRASTRAAERFASSLLRNMLAPTLRAHVGGGGEPERTSSQRRTLRRDARSTRWQRDVRVRRLAVDLDRSFHRNDQRAGSATFRCAVLPSTLTDRFTATINALAARRSGVPSCRRP